MNERIRLNPAEASDAGTADARQLLADMTENPENIPAANLLYTPIVEIIALASENRFEESEARLTAFCSIIGPALERAVALEAKCALLVDAR